MSNPEEKSWVRRSFRGIVMGLLALVLASAVLGLSGGEIRAETKKKTVSPLSFTNVKSTLTLTTSTKSKTIKVKVNSAAKGKKLVWKSGKTSVATVSKKGKVKIKKPGVTKITCYVKGHKKQKAVCTLRVKPVLVSSVKLKASDPVVQVGETYKGATSVTVLPKNAYNRKVTFSSSNKKVAKVDAKTGVVTGKGIGSATITCKANDGSKKKITYKLTVIGKIMAGSTRFIAHRGYSDVAPENTIKAFTLAGKNGFWGCESDVWKTKDGHFVMHHDKNALESCGVDIKIANMTLEDVRALTIQSGNNINLYKNDPQATRIPTFEEYLQVCRDYDMVPIIDIKIDYGLGQQTKARGDMKALYDIVAKIMGNREVKFVDFDLETLVQMRSVIDEAEKAAKEELARQAEEKAKKEAEEKTKKEEEEQQSGGDAAADSDAQNPDAQKDIQKIKALAAETAKTAEDAEATTGEEQTGAVEGQETEGAEINTEINDEPLVPTVLPKVTLQHLSKYPNTNLINFYANRGIQLSTSHEHLTESQLKTFHKKGIVVDVYTVNKEEDTWTWISRDVDFITTNKAFWL